MQTHALYARIAPALAVFPYSTVFLQPDHTPFDNPTFRHDLKGGWLRTLSKLYLHLRTQNVSYTLAQRSTNIAAITQYTLHLS